MTDTRNAKITSTRLTIEDHGIFCAWLMLDYGGSGQGFGGYALDGKSKRESGSVRPGTAFGCDYITGILRTLEVTEWEKLRGTYCRAVIENGTVVRIGHPLKDSWFDPQLLTKYHEGKKKDE